MATQPKNARIYVYVEEKLRTDPEFLEKLKEKYPNFKSLSYNPEKGYISYIDNDYTIKRFDPEVFQTWKDAYTQSQQSQTPNRDSEPTPEPTRTPEPTPAPPTPEPEPTPTPKDPPKPKTAQERLNEIVQESLDNNKLVGAITANSLQRTNDMFLWEPAKLDELEVGDIISKNTSDRNKFYKIESIEQIDGEYFIQATCGNKSVTFSTMDIEKALTQEFDNRHQTSKPTMETLTEAIKNEMPGFASNGTNAQTIAEQFGIPVEDVELVAKALAVEQEFGFAKANPIWDQIQETIINRSEEIGLDPEKKEAWKALAQNIVNQQNEMEEVLRDLESKKEEYNQQIESFNLEVAQAQTAISEIQNNSAEIIKQALKETLREGLQNNVSDLGNTIEARRAEVQKELDDEIRMARDTIAQNQASVEETKKNLEDLKKQLEQAKAQFNAMNDLYLLTNIAQKAEEHAPKLIARQDRGEQIISDLSDLANEYKRESERVRENSSLIRRAFDSVKDLYMDIKNDLAISREIYRENRNFNKEFNKDMDELRSMQKQINQESQNAIKAIQGINKSNWLIEKCESHMIKTMKNKKYASLQQDTGVTKLTEEKEKKLKEIKQAANEQMKNATKAEKKKIQQEAVEKINQVTSFYDKKIAKAQSEVNVQMQKWEASPKFRQDLIAEYSNSKNIILKGKADCIKQYQESLRKIEEISKAQNDKRQSLLHRLSSNATLNYKKVQSFQQQLEEAAMKYNKTLTEEILRSGKQQNLAGDIIRQSAIDEGYRNNDATYDHYSTYVERGRSMLGSQENQNAWKKAVDNTLRDNNRSFEVEAALDILECTKKHTVLVGNGLVGIVNNEQMKADIENILKNYEKYDIDIDKVQKMFDSIGPAPGKEAITEVIKNMNESREEEYERSR